MKWFIENAELVADLFVQHAWISVVATALGFVLSLPIGRFAHLHPRMRGFTVAFVGIFYAIPSIAFFILLPGVLGTSILSVVNVVIALAIYAAAIMVRTTTDAFDSVSTSVTDAATAAGFAGLQRFMQVDFPLAGPVLLAGLRVVSVSTVSMLSVASLIGVESLGNLFTDGFRREVYDEVIVGIVATIVLAVLLDTALFVAGRLLMPWVKVVAEANR